MDKRIDHFTVLCSVTWPLNDSETGGDLALIQTSLLFHVNALQSNLLQVTTQNVKLKLSLMGGGLL